MSNQELFDTMLVKPNVEGAVKAKTDAMLTNKERYAHIARNFINPGLKWWLVAVIHEMECSQNFTKYLGNGQSLNQVTTIVPIGRGPFPSFEAGAIDALKLKRANDITDWSIDNVLHFLEGYNGYGYSKYHNMNSPYLWSGSQYYTSGKYDTDGHFDADIVSQQIGVALMLKVIIDK
jgi:lysozyme family protein